MKILVVLLAVASLATAFVSGRHHVHVSQDGTVEIQTDDGKQIVISKHIASDGQKHIQVKIHGPNGVSKVINIDVDNEEHDKDSHHEVSKLPENYRTSSRYNIDNEDEKRSKRSLIGDYSQFHILFDICKNYQGDIDDVEFQTLLYHIQEAVEKGQINEVIFKCVQCLNHQKLWDNLILGNGLLGLHNVHVIDSSDSLDVLGHVDIEHALENDIRSSHDIKHILAKVAARRALKNHILSGHTVGITDASHILAEVAAKNALDELELEGHDITSKLAHTIAVMAAEKALATSVHLNNINEHSVDDKNDHILAVNAAQRALESHQLNGEYTGSTYAEGLAVAAAQEALDVGHLHGHDSKSDFVQHLAEKAAHHAVNDVKHSQVNDLGSTISEVIAVDATNRALNNVKQKGLHISSRITLPLAIAAAQHALDHIQMNGQDISSNVARTIAIAAAQDLLENGQFDSLTTSMHHGLSHGLWDHDQSIHGLEWGQHWGQPWVQHWDQPWVQNWEHHLEQPWVHHWNHKEHLPSTTHQHLFGLSEENHQGLSNSVVRNEDWNLPWGVNPHMLHRELNDPKYNVISGIHKPLIGSHDLTDWNNMYGVEDIDRVHHSVY